MSIRREAAAILALALPSIGGQLAGMAQNAAEVVIAGHAGPAVLGAVSVGSGVWALGFLSMLGLFNAIPPSVAQLDGAGRRAEAGALFRQALVLAACAGLVLGLFMGLAAPALLRLLHLDPALTAAASGFLRGASLGGPGLCLFLACRGFSDGLAMPKPGMLANLAGLLASVPLGYGLIFGAWGLPALGATGAGLAEAAVISVEFAGIAAWLRWSGRFPKLGRAPVSPRAIAGLLRLGLPMAVAILLEASLFSVSALAIARFGAVPAAGHQVALTTAGLFFMVPLGLATAVTVRVGQAAGRLDRAGLRRAGLTGLGLAAGFEAVTCALLLCVPVAVAGVFSQEAAVIAAAAPLLQLAGVFQIPDGVQVVAAGALRGVKDVVVPMVITAVAYWGVGMPLALGLAFWADWQAAGMWTGLIAGLAAAAVLLSARFLAVSRGRLR